MMPPPPLRIVPLAAFGGLLLSALVAAGVRADESPKPSKVAGSWTWSWKDTAGETHRHVLEVEGIDTKLAARERFDDLPPIRVTDLKFDGKKIHFTVVRAPRRAEYSGVLEDDGSAINGTVIVTTDDQPNEFPWKATPEARTKETVKPDPAK